MDQIYTEIGLVHADEDEAPARIEPRTFDEVIGHPTPTASVLDDSTEESDHATIDREIFGFLVTP